jgi:U3 small nucleolar RNA-associated protein 15
LIYIHFKRFATIQTPTMTTVITTARTTTNEFKPSIELQSKKPTTKSITSALPGAVSDSSEARYWSNKFGLGDVSGSIPQFAHPRKLLLKAGSAAMVHKVLFGPAAFTSFNPLAVVSGPRVRLYGTTQQSTFHRQLTRHSRRVANDIVADRQVQTGGHLALTAAYRHDGRLMAVGLENGQVRIADATSRATLCTFESTTTAKLPMRVLQWFRDGQHLLSAGDDGVVRVWQLSQGALGARNALLELTGHGDAIRCAELWQMPAKESQGSWPNRALAFTGSYDHTIRIWSMDDIVSAKQQEDSKEIPQEDRCLSVLSHGAPVEAILLMPSTDPNVPVWLLSVGGTAVKVWNPLTGLCVSTTLAQHRKTITSLIAAPRENSETGETYVRIVTAGLDGLFRVHTWDSQTGQIAHLHGIKLPMSITCLAMNEAADRLAIGTIEGTVLVRQKGPSLTQHKRQREPKAGTYSFFTRGMNADVVEGDYVVEATSKKRKLRNFDIALKEFRYGDALDEALKTRIPQVVVAVLEELGKRRGLTIALSNRDEESLEPLLSFTVRYVARPRFSALLVGVANKLIDIYSNVSGQSEVIDELFDKLTTQVSGECRAQKMLLRVMGQLDAIMSTAERDESR